MADLPNILIVDDEAQNLEIITEYLSDKPCTTTSHQSSVQAWQELESNPTAFDLILLDWMMPEMDGLELLGRIKQNPALKFTPVIMQTARTDRQDILRGMAGGAYYYLTKPYSQVTLCGIVNAALDDIQRFKQLESSLQQSDPGRPLQSSAEFELRNLNEADQLATLLANSCPEPGKVISGISELLINAIEHGNLHIGYAEKSALKKDGVWREEIERRLRQVEYQNKVATVRYDKNASSINITVTDQGLGFNWRSYLDFDPERAFDCNGRGIAMARMMSFDELQYNDAGNQVTAIIKI